MNRPKDLEDTPRTGGVREGSNSNASEFIPMFSKTPFARKKQLDLTRYNTTLPTKHIIQKNAAFFKQQQHDYSFFVP